MYVQTVVIDNYEKVIQKYPDPQVVWLLYEVLIFYFNIFALFIFLVFSRCKSFRTEREKAGFGANMRYQVDFLYFASPDIHWFTIIFQQLFLCLYALYKRLNYTRFSITYSLAFVILRHIFDFFIVYRIFF
jgi:hypothetical protein